MQQFNPIDAALLFLEQPRTPFHVSTISIYDPSTCPGDKPTFEDIVQAVQSNLHVAPAFRQKIVRVPLDIDHPYWVEDENFDIEYHMHHIALPRPGNREQFRELVSRNISRPLDLSRSPWEMTIISGLDAFDGLPEGCFATILKVHHCAIDGKAGVAIINALHQLDPAQPPVQVEDNWQPEKKPNNYRLLSRGLFNNVRSRFAMAQPVVTNARKLVSSAFKEIIKGDEDAKELKAPDTILNGSISARRIVDDVTCPLDVIKDIRRCVDGATVNDVCLTVVAEAMRLYLRQKNALPKSSLVTVVPISIRLPEQVEDVSGNQIAITRVSMGTDIADPIQRLRDIAAQTAAKKSVQEGVVMSVLLRMVYNLPGTLIGAAARAIPLVVTRANSFSNTMVTNVPGPMQPLYMLGAQAVHMIGSPPLMDGGAVLHSVGSYNGRFMFCFVACREKMPDYDVYRDCIAQAIENVSQAAAADQQKSKTKPKARKAKE